MEIKNSPAAPARIRTRNLSITSPALLPTSYPGGKGEVYNTSTRKLSYEFPRKIQSRCIRYFSKSSLSLFARAHPPCIQAERKEEKEEKRVINWPNNIDTQTGVITNTTEYTNP